MLGRWKDANHLTSDDTQRITEGYMPIIKKIEEKMKLLNTETTDASPAKVLKLNQIRVQAPNADET